MEKEGHKSHMGQIGHKVSYEIPFDLFDSFDFLELSNQ
jgi:hypothetical protein